MSYCTVADLIDTYSEQDIIRLTDRINKPPVAIDTTVLNQAIEDVAGEIDLYLTARYNLPLSSIPLTIRRIAVTLVYRNLHTRITDDHPAELAAVRQRKLLDGLASGKLSLGKDLAGTPVQVNNTIQISPGRNDWSRGKY